MSKSPQYAPLLMSALLMVLALVAMYPCYQYYIDPDGTAYLTISRRYAEGDFATAINGYWSPWACWLTAGLVRLGVALIPASVCVNSLAAVGFLCISHSFFMKFGLNVALRRRLCLTLAGFLCFAVFWQSFDDLWECFFLLAVLRLMMENDFQNRPVLWLVSGAIGALAYFAKAYSFPFFILNMLCCSWLITGGSVGKTLKIAGAAITVMTLCSLPWIMALHHKYGMWTTATAGPLNTSWYLLGHPIWKEGISVLLPPAYPGSPSYWEDPWLVNGPTPHFWSSSSLLGRQVMRSGYNVIKFIISSLQLSLCFPLLLLIIIRNARNAAAKALLPEGMPVLLLSCLLFPLAYFLVNFESRYLWYMLPPSMAFGGWLLQTRPQSFRLSPKLALALFPLSYLWFPAYGLVSMYHKGHREFTWATQMKAASVSGSFTSNMPPADMERLAFFSGNPYYFMLPLTCYQCADSVVQELDRYHVQYYVHGINGKSLFEDRYLLLLFPNRFAKVSFPDQDGVQIYRVIPENKTGLENQPRH